jgi:glycosyltransferase involved in cell wall biosynthesis
MRPKKENIVDGARLGEPNIEFVRRLIHTPLSGGKTLLDYTTFDGVSYWWNVDTTFYESVLNQTSYRPPRGLKRVLPRLYRRFGVAPQLLYDLALRLLSRVASRGFKTREGSIAVITQDVEWRKIRDDETGRLVETDAFFHTIINRLKRDYPLVSTYPLDVAIPGGFKISLRKRSWALPHRPLNYYWGPKAWLVEQRSKRRFSESWDVVKNDPVLRRLCVHEGRDLYPVVRDRLESYFLYVLPQAAKMVETAKMMLSVERVSLLLLQNEYSWRERSLVVAKSLGTPVLAVQHGIIIPTHKGYMYRRDEVSPTLSVDAPYCPLPDYTAVFGESYRSLLVEESAYPPSRVVVTGPPRYDLLIDAGRIYNKTRFNEKQGIADGQKLILWATQCHSLSDDENRANIEVILGAVEKMGDVTLIIKQHPAEAPRYTQMLSDGVSKHGGKVVIVPKSSDTFEQLYACDLLITKNSTTGVEAVALGKPVVVLNLGGTPDAVDYVKEGVAFGVYDPKDLEGALTSLLLDDSEQARHRPVYIRETIYKNDGGASERVATLIKRIIREGTKGDLN